MELQYKAKNENGSIQSGVLVAESKQEARARLKKQGLFVVKMEPAAAGSASKEAAPRFSRRGIRKNDLLMLTSQLNIICRAGLDIAEAIEIVNEECPNPSLSRILDQIHADISNGVCVSEALRVHSKVFGEAYVAAVAAGEASGTLPEILERLTELLDNEIRMAGSVRSVLAYPTILAGVLLIVVGVLIFFVLPQFSKVFVSLGKSPPAQTRILLELSTFLRSHVILIAGVSVSSMIAAWQYLRTETATRYRDTFFVRNRLLRKPTRALITGRSFRLLGTMLQSGIPLLDGIRLCRNSLKNHVFRDLFDRMDQSVVSGGSIGVVLKESQLLPPGVSQIVGAAERTGQLGPVMTSVGAHFEQDGEKQIKELAKLIEPCVVVVMGIVVSGVVMSVMLPLLDVSTSAH